MHFCAVCAADTHTSHHFHFKLLSIRSSFNGYALLNVSSPSIEIINFNRNGKSPKTLIRNKCVFIFTHQSNIVKSEREHSSVNNGIKRFIIFQARAIFIHIAQLLTQINTLELLKHALFALFSLNSVLII